MDTNKQKKALPAAKEAATGAHKRPVWSRTINPVDCSIWPHDQAEEVRHTIAISRSYKDRKSGEWKRNFYFDYSDLADVKAVCEAAAEEILRMHNMADKPDED